MLKLNSFECLRYIRSLPLSSHLLVVKDMFLFAKLPKELLSKEQENCSCLKDALIVLICCVTGT